MFKKTVMAGFVAAALGSGLTPAQAADPTPEHTVTGNVGLFSQYVFRGLKQTNGKPALQGGFDYSHSSGFYAGTWASNVSVLADGAPPAYMDGGSLEWDFYGGYKWGFANDFTLDLGTLYYYYPGSANTTATKGGGPLNPKADTWEIYAGLSWKFLSAKYSYSVDNKTFALADSKGTYYLDLSANYPVGDSGFTLVAHYGIQKYSGTDPRLLGTGLNNDAIASYEDWKLGVNYTLPKDFTIGVFYTDTSGANSLYYGSPGDTPAGTYPKNIAKGTGTIFISKTF
jgi:uncharacterized protein (TIGR02001 family)